MNIKKFVDELVEIAKNPRLAYVTVTQKDIYKTLFTFIGPDAFYYPDGIKRIELQRGGAGVIYVYTTNAGAYPHFTIPFDKPIHWTDENGKNQGVEGAPDAIQKLMKIFK